MINTVRSLFSGGNIVDVVDSLVLTDQEKNDHTERMLSLYEPFKIAQRLLALIFCIPYAVGWSFIFAASFFGFETRYQVELLGGTMGQIVLAIIAFYFLGGVVSGLKEGRK